MKTMKWVLGLLCWAWLGFFQPALGRYVESDPVGLKGGVNTYGYAFQAPLRYTDPQGQQSEAALAVCVAGGPANPLCDTAVILNICKWGGIGLGALIIMSSDSADKCHGDDGKCAEPTDCKQVKQQCIQMCSDTTLPTRNNGFSFFNCLNRCMADNGCAGQ